MNAYVREYQKIEKQTRRRDNFLIRYLPILLLFVGAAVIVKIYMQSVAIEWSRRVIDQQRMATELQLENEELVRAIESLETRARVARDARNRLGMVVSTEDDIVWLPVLDGAGAAPVDGVAAVDDRRPAEVVQGWLDALWQEEALALTSR